MKTTIGTIYFLLNAIAFIYLWFTMQCDAEQTFFIFFLVFVCVYAAVLINYDKIFKA